MKVIDGDTLDIEIDLGLGIKSLQRVRLAGVDAPEIRTKDIAERAAGAASMNFVVDWVKSHGDVYLRTQKDNDKYGRYLAHVYPQSDDFSGESLNQLLVKTGHATPYM